MASHAKSQDAALTGALSAGGTGRGLLARAWAALGAWVAAVFFWRSVSRAIDRLSSLSDADLKRLGLERNEIVARVYEEARAAQDRRAGAAGHPRGL
ncbi:hypothetical protein AAFN88_00880 [Pelagibius sp. CAU 1746]|uniref:hypothetical protein n=1 Tax=Pelagibius sp. CAU 1746 TaxID=3140370 RepID=UPI00325A55B1